MAPLSPRMIILALLSKLRFARDYTKRCLGRLALLSAFLSRRKFSKWWHSRPGKPDTSQTLKTADPPFLGIEANSCPVSGSPAIVKQYTVAASSVPPLASLPSLHEHVERQPATAAPSIGVDAPPLAAGRDPRAVNRRSASTGSTKSRASERFSIITTSRDSTRARDDQPSRPSRQSRPNTSHDSPHPSPDIITTNLPSPSLDHEDGRVSPVLQPWISSPHVHHSLNLSPMDEVRMRQSPTSFVVDVQNPSTESLPITGFSVVSLHDEPVPGSPTSSNAPTLEYLPYGRFVQLINPEQLSRHKKGALMQVELVETFLMPARHTLMQV